MSFPLFRFTLNNTIEGSKSISEPGGWDQAILQFNRHEEYHSLVEEYNDALTFYGEDATHDGGYDYIKNIEFTQGPDAQITITVEISEDDGASYLTVFSGLIDITSIKEIDEYEIQCGLIRNDFWQKFINRKDTPVDLSATVDLDGNAITGISSYSFILLNQKIRQYLVSSSPVPILVTSTGTEFFYLVDPGVIEKDEINIRNALVTGVYDQVTIGSTTVVSQLWYEFEYDGDYTFDIRIEASIFTLAVGRSPGAPWRFHVYRKDGTFGGSGFFTEVNFTSGGNTSTVYTFTSTLSLLKGDQIAMFGEMAVFAGGDQLLVYGNPGASTPGPPSGIASVATYFNITADTKFENTTADVFSIFDAAQSIIGKETGIFDCLNSSYFNGGCGKDYILTKGLLVRGYLIGDKPFTMSFQNWWDGANPIFNLGLGDDGGKIRIEPKRHFYDDSSTSVNFNYVNKIERSYDTKKILKAIEIGFADWSAESGSGIDDPQTKHTYSTRFKTVGEDIQLLSTFYAASLGIEQTRRNTIEPGKDWRLDEKIMIIACSNLNNTLPELDENFASISGLLNADTRYNTRITPARNLIRWLDFTNGCVQTSLSNAYQFASGEGNVGVDSDLDPGDCEFTTHEPIGENDPIDATTDFLFIPYVYTFETPMTFANYQAIKAAPTKCIGFSKSNSGHTKAFIINCEYHVTQGFGKFTVILGQSTPL